MSYDPSKHYRLSGTISEAIRVAARKLDIAPSAVVSLILKLYLEQTVERLLGEQHE